MNKLLRFSVPVLASALALGAMAPSTFATPTPASITVTAPTAASSLSGTTSVTWTNTGTWTGNKVNIYYSSDNFVSTTTLTTGVNASAGTYSWNTTAQSNTTTGKIKIVAATDATIFNTTGNFTINNLLSQAALTVTGLPASATYQQASITAGTSGGSGSGAVTFSASGSTACSIDSSLGTVSITSGTGTCSITATKAADSTYSATTSAAVSITVSKATPTATLSVTNSPVTYSGSSQSATVGVSSSSVSGSATSISTGGAATQTTAGTYAVTATFTPTDTANYNSLTGLSAGNFVINKATPTISVTNSPVVDNGSAQAAVVTGSVAGAATNIMYDGAATQPSSVGTYAVTADFAPTDSTNYASLTGASAGNFVITAAPVDITSVNAISDIHVVNGTALGSVGLPTTAGVTYRGASTGSLAVTWDGGTPAYDGSTNATYVFSGTLTLSGGVTNTGSLKAQVSVIVAAVPTYTLTYSAGSNGSLTGTTTQSVASGSDGTAVTAVADSGFHFVDWSDASTTNPRIDTGVTNNISVTANFAQDPTPTPAFVGAGAGGSPTPTPTVITPVGQVLGAATSTLPAHAAESAATSTVTVTAPGQVLGAAIFNFVKNLFRGMHHSDVNELQKLLIGKGYAIPDGVTDYFGPQTYAAVKAFQKASGLPVTGFVGPLTRALLNKAS